MAISVNHLLWVEIEPYQLIESGVDDDSYEPAGGEEDLPFTSWRRLIMMLVITAELSVVVSELGVPGIYKIHGPSGNRTLSDANPNSLHSCTTDTCIDAC
jgi:hypothetical protein